MRKANLSWLLRLAGILTASLGLLWAAAAQADTTTTTHPYTGVTYIDRTETSPQTVMHIVEIDLTAPGISFLVTPGGGPLDTVTQRTVDALNAQHAQVAINGGFFVPAPPVTNANVVGLAASKGTIYSPFEPQPVASGYADQSYAILPYAPALNIDAANNASIVHRDASYADNKHVLESVTLWNAVAGSAQIVTNGVKTIPTYTGNPTGLNPISGYSDSNSWYALARARTAVGLTADLQTLVLFTVDAAGGSSGMSVGQVADIMMNDYHVYNALNLDGGGSTSLAMADPVTHVGGLVNVSADSDPLGRAVANNLLVFAVPEPATIGLLVTGLALFAARRRRATTRNQDSKEAVTMRGQAVILAVVGGALVLLAGGAAQAGVLSPYTQNYEAIASGGSPSDATVGSSGATTDTWSVVVDSNGDHWYENSLTAGKGFSTVQVTNLSTTAPSNNFEVSAVLKPVSTSSPGSVNYTEGIVFLAASPTSITDWYVADLNVGTNPGRMRLVEWTGGTAVVYPSSTQSAQPLVPNFSATNTYLMDVKGTYNGSNALTVVYTVTQVDNANNTQSYTYGADSTPRTGQYFGLYDSMGSGGGTMVADYDNFTVTPEPATLSLLALGGLAAIRMRKNRK